MTKSLKACNSKRKPMHRQCSKDYKGDDDDDGNGGDGGDDDSDDKKRTMKSTLSASCRSIVLVPSYIGADGINIVAQPQRKQRDTKINRMQGQLFL